MTKTVDELMALADEHAVTYSNWMLDRRSPADLSRKSLRTAIEQALAEATQAALQSWLPLRLALAETKQIERERAAKVAEDQCVGLTSSHPAFYALTKCAAAIRKEPTP